MMDSEIEARRLRTENEKLRHTVAGLAAVIAAVTFVLIIFIVVAATLAGKIAQAGGG